jgi:threonine dehydratase
MITASQIRCAARRIRPVARVTPLLEVSGPVGSSVFLKCENLQATGSFKIRGAINMLAQLTDDERQRGVITYSSGNHGQAVALAARELGIRAVVVMPTRAPAIKVNGARGYGAEVICAGTTSADRRARAEDEAAARDLTIVPPFDHDAIIAGQGTVGLEILDQYTDVATVLVPVGGGGLLAGVAAALKQSKPEVRVVGVEPTGAASMKASLDAGHPVTLKSTHSIADGLLPLRPGNLTFAYARRFVDQVVVVRDSVIVDALQWLFSRAKLVVESSGATAVAAVLAEPNGVGGEGPVVAILSGGNVDLTTMTELRASSPALSGVGCGT